MHAVTCVEPLDISFIAVARRVQGWTTERFRKIRGQPLVMVRVESVFERVRGTRVLQTELVPSPTNRQYDVESAQSLVEGVECVRQSEQTLPDGIVGFRRRAAT